MTILDAKSANSLSGGPSFSLRNRLYRFVWTFVWALFAAWTPRPFNRWRVWLLRRFGADVHPRAQVHGRARVWSPAHLVMHEGASLGPGAIAYSIAPIVLERRALVSQGAHLCTGSHDIEDTHFQLLARPIRVGPYAWIAAEAFVGPGVNVGEGAVLGARGCATRDLAAWTVHSGNPATPLRARRWRPDD